ncbi:MAG TPA: YkgJ family cysteine cluster protein, partial [Candidatus Blautia stercorigallinarum]|nr:YkgJ family cysteine cluster protein [Candidatus Blautia stercorigallinarum]
MEKIIRDVIEKNRNTKLLDTDTFDFRCTCCGACCTNREDIVMSGYDVMRIQNHLGIDFTELLEKYCELYVGRPSGIPLLRIKPKGAKKICPFLFRSKCKIHEVKPTVCALFPVGRATAFDKESGKPEVMYFVQQTNCGAKDVSNNLQEWIRGCISEYDEKCGMLWNQMLRAVLAFISGIKGEI